MTKMIFVGFGSHFERLFGCRCAVHSNLSSGLWAILAKIHLQKNYHTPTTHPLSAADSNSAFLLLSYSKLSWVWAAFWLSARALWWSRVLSVWIITCPLWDCAGHSRYRSKMNSCNFKTVFHLLSIIIKKKTI